MKKHLSPPTWAPYAIATNQGWVHPKTGEILVSHRNLKTKIDELTAPVTPDLEPVQDEPVETVSIEMDTAPNTSEESVPLIDTVPAEKRTRGRPKKT